MYVCVCLCVCMCVCARLVIGVDHNQMVYTHIYTHHIIYSDISRKDF